jgi:hypothetical protein
MDLQIVHALSLMESSPVRHHRGSTDAPTKVIVEPRVHRCEAPLCFVSLIRVFSMLFPLAHTLVWQSLQFTFEHFDCVEAYLVPFTVKNFSSSGRRGKDT